jgi:hypothetical protein
MRQAANGILWIGKSDLHRIVQSPIANRRISPEVRMAEVRFELRLISDLP